MTPRDSSIVADGPRRLRAAGGCREDQWRIWTAFVRGCVQKRTTGPLWRRLAIQVKLLRACREELKKKFPPTALHLSSSAR